VLRRRHPEQAARHYCDKSHPDVYAECYQAFGYEAFATCDVSFFRSGRAPFNRDLRQSERAKSLKTAPKADGADPANANKQEAR
jgi:hypothetical protein